MDDAKLLGDYRLQKLLGQGSMGAVWVAEHRFTKRQYALKILPEELASDRGFLQRFEDEIAQIAVLDHPNIVKAYNVSFSQGMYFLVTDCIVDALGESTNCAQYFKAKEKNLTEQEILSIAEQVAEALDYGHTLSVGQNKRLIHRGLKLNNILMGQPQEYASSLPKVYVSDWGLSKIIGTGACLTRMYKAMAESLGIPTNVIFAKPGLDKYPQPSIETQKLHSLHQSFVQSFSFLAPEQKRIDVPGDEKIDVWSFGVLLYFLLTGEYPEGIFAFPSQKRSDLTVDWDRVIVECLQANPSDRPSSLIELLQNAKMPKQVKHEIHATHTQEVAEKFAAFEQQHEMQDEPVAICTTAKQKDIFKEQIEQASHYAKDLFTSTPYVADSVVPIRDEPLQSVGFSEKFVKEYQPEKRSVNSIKPLLTDMQVIKEGYYFRGNNNGCRDEMPRHQILVNSFAIDIHPVTNEQFVRFLEIIGGEKDTQNHDIIRLKDSRIRKSAGKYCIEPGYAKHPVVGVSWYGAVAYAKWVGKRLPTEAEWEVACSGGLENPVYPTGESIEKTQANFFSSDTTAVMSYPSNGYGLFDLAGNVYEWCQDWYEYTYYETSAQEPDNPKGPLQGVYRVLRGGCWKSLNEDLRTAKRHRNNPGAANGTYGFRCAMDA